MLRTVTNEISSFCIDNRLRQVAFFRLRQSKGGAKAGFRVMLKYFGINKAFRYYIKRKIPCCRSSDSVIERLSMTFTANGKRQK